MPPTKIKSNRKTNELDVSDINLSNYPKSNDDSMIKNKKNNNSNDTIRQSFSSRNLFRKSISSSNTLNDINYDHTTIQLKKNQINTITNVDMIPYQLKKNISSSKTGFLTKRAISSLDAFANWKQRFFILSDGILSYYKQGSGSIFFNSSKEEMAHLKGEITLTKDTIVRKKPIDDKINCFEVVTPTKKLFAQADSETEMEEWVNAIQSHINAIEYEVKRPSIENELSSLPLHSLMMEETEYSRPSILEENDIIKLIDIQDKVSDPKDNLIKQLVDENRCLRKKIIEKEQQLQLLMEGRNSILSDGPPSTPSGLQSNNSNNSNRASSNNNKNRIGGPNTVLDLREVRKKQFQLWDAAEVGDITGVTRLLGEAIVDINGKGIEQWTALHLASSYNHPQIIKLLLSRGACVHSKTRERLTPLHIAAKNGFHSCVEILLSNGADPNLTDQGGNGVIHLAAEGGHIEIVKLLLSHGCKTDVPNASGNLPVHLAPIGHPIRVLLGAAGTEFIQTQSSQILTNKDTPVNNNVEEEKEDVHVAFRNKYQQDLALGPRDFEFVKVLGRGAFAIVYLVRGKGSNRNKWYALKAYSKQAIVQKNQARYIHTEKAALQACSDHPYIVTLYYAFQSKDRIFLVMEYCGGGDLLSALSRRKNFTEPEACFYIAEIVLAIVHLHSKNIVFRDLKPENVVMDLEGHCLLTDFGISKEGIQDHSSANTFCGSPMYLAPEMLSRSGHGFALDWYSVGALLYELLTGLPPYYANDKKQLFHNILKGNLPIPEYISPVAKSILLGLLNKDPSKRLGSGSLGNKEIIQHPFFQKIDWQALYDRKIPPPFKPEIKNDICSGEPDISNFPQTFTDQTITDVEKGLESPNASRQCVGSSSSSLSYNNRMSTGQNRQFFEDFDFTPQLTLNKEAEEFEKLALAYETNKNKKSNSTESTNNDNIAKNSNKIHNKQEDSTIQKDVEHSNDNINKANIDENGRDIEVNVKDSSSTPADTEEFCI